MQGRDQGAQPGPQRSQPAQPPRPPPRQVRRSCLQASCRLRAPVLCWRKLLLLLTCLVLWCPSCSAAALWPWASVSVTACFTLGACLNWHARNSLVGCLRVPGGAAGHSNHACLLVINPTRLTRCCALRAAARAGAAVQRHLRGPGAGGAQCGRGCGARGRRAVGRAGRRRDRQHQPGRLHQQHHPGRAGARHCRLVLHAGRMRSAVHAVQSPV